MNCLILNLRIQQSGKTLGVLQKVRIDVERLISAFVNILFTTLVGVIFVTVYAVNVHWVIAPIFFAAVPILGIVSSVLSKKIKKIQQIIVEETTALAGTTTESLRNIELVKSLGLGNQEINRLNSTTDKILQLELKKVKYIRTAQFYPGNGCEFYTHHYTVLYALFNICSRDPDRTVFHLDALLILYIWTSCRVLGDIINIYREAEVSLDNFDNLLKQPVDEKPKNPGNYKE